MFRNIYQLTCKQSVKFNARTMGSQRQGPKMILSKEVAMVDERINVEVFGLKAFQEVTLVAGLSHSDAVYVSHGHFKANSDGYISLLHTPSTGGTYTGTDSMGLFWSMVPAKSTKTGARLFNRDITKPFEVNIAAVDGYNSFPDQMATEQQSVLCSAVAQTWYQSKDVTRQPIREGRVRGTLFMPKVSELWTWTWTSCGSHLHGNQLKKITHLGPALVGCPDILTPDLHWLLWTLSGLTSCVL